MKKTLKSIRINPLKWTKLLGVGLTIALLQGCGDSEDLSSTNNGSGVVAPNLRTVQGLVTGPGGGRLQNAKISVEERSTHYDRKVFTDSNGAYALDLPEGVYDIIVDPEGDEASGVFGPIEVTTDLQTDFSLVQADPRSGLVSGRILEAPGRPAANRRLRLVPATATSKNPLEPAEVPDIIETTTDSEGNFQADFATDQETGFDLEIYDATGSLDEFVNIYKPSGALNVELSVEDSPVENSVRAGEWSGNPPQGTRLQPPPPARFRAEADRGFFFDDFTLSGGLIPNDFKFRPWTDYLSRQPDPPFRRLNSLLFEDGGYGNPEIQCNGDGDFGYDHQLVLTSGNIDAVSVVYRFYDRTGSSYSLRRFAASINGTNMLNYDSALPDINKVEIRF